MNPIIKLIIGFVGVLFFGAGGYFLFEGLFQLSANQGRWVGDYAFSGWGFGAFFIHRFRSLVYSYERKTRIRVEKPCSARGSCRPAFCSRLAYFLQIQYNDFAGNGSLKVSFSEKIHT